MGLRQEGRLEGTAGLERVSYFRGAEGSRGSRVGAQGRVLSGIRRHLTSYLSPSAGAQGQGDRTGTAGGTGQDPLLSGPA